MPVVSFRTLNSKLFFFYVEGEPFPTMNKYITHCYNVDSIERFCYESSARRLSVFLRDTRNPIEIFLTPNEYIEYFLNQFK